MSQEDIHQESKVAYCEDDYEDDEEAATPLANVAVKRANAASITKRASYERRRNDGSDSGYSSKTNTNTSTSSRNMADLKIDTTMERQPQPYSFIQRPETHRRSSSRVRQEVVVEPPKWKAKYYVHKQEEGCYVCDTYGEHLPEDLRPRDPPVPPSPRGGRKVQEHIPRRAEPQARLLRRESSGRAARPASMYVPGPTQLNYPPQIPNSAHYPPMSPMWSNPVTPSMPFSPFSYAAPVMTTTFVAEPSYFEAAPQRENRPARTSHRASMHGDVIIRQSKAESRPVELQRTSSTREQSRTREHSRSDPDRAKRAIDYDGMPPPARPIMTLAHRPGMQKSATYNTGVTGNSTRGSQLIDDDAAYAGRNTSPTKERRVEPSVPPSSYRGPTEAFRPPNRTSKSYEIPGVTTKISSSTLPVTPTSHPRRSTTSGTPAETRKLADAEEYQSRQSLRRSFTSNELTVEALRNLKQRNPSTRSETSSHRSHHTKSSSSAGGKSKRSNSEIKMVINGVTVLIDAETAKEKNISISTHRDGDATFSLSGRGDRDDGGSRVGSQKRIEKAPSATSRTSRVSSKSVGSKERGRELEKDRERAREREKILEPYARARGTSAAGRSRSSADPARRSYDYGAHDKNVWGD
jgi:hypothetical protein